MRPAPARRPGVLRACAILLLAAAGCAGGQAKTGRGAVLPDRDPAEERKAEIRELWQQIREWRLQAGMPHLPSAATKLNILRIPLSALGRTCVPSEPDPASERCTDVCNLAEAICDNAGSICRIAAELGGDPWADDKCQDAKASCQEANERCCGCQGGEGGEGH